ncbi:hypothetical protein [Cellulomonas massiliensis]|uniref:hypothetical protein n=1 Tax=Cellulomonas massiliensis TaxID=1465811 RepID=UPI000315251F|nr:hypothetical protein [Cellulomonas massiliensis]
MRARPTTLDEVARLVVARAGALDGWVRVAVDGAPPTEPAALADLVAERLRVAGRPVLRVSADDFLRPASVRLEHGREDPDAFYEDRLDTGALAREVLDPLEPAGTGLVLPSLWDARRDRATRADRVPLGPGGAVVLDGSLLLGRWLALDVVVHLAVRPATLARRTPAELAWTLPAYGRYADEVGLQEVADVVVLVDDPRHPALVEG